MNSSQSLQLPLNMARFLAGFKEWCSTHIKMARQISSSESPIYCIQHFLRMNSLFRPSTIHFPICLGMLMELNCFFFFVSHISTGKTSRGKSLPHFIISLYSDKDNRILIFVGLTSITVVQTRMIALLHSRNTATKPFILWELLEE